MWIVFPNDKVGMTVRCPVRQPGETEEDMLEREGKAGIVVDRLPMSAFRGAWRLVGTEVVVDMPAAREIKTNQIRRERDKRLAAADVAYMRADEAGDVAEKARVASVKRQLRDLPAAIQPQLEVIDTPEALDAFTPTWPE